MTAYANKAFQTYTAAAHKFDNALFDARAKLAKTKSATKGALLERVIDQATQAQPARIFSFEVLRERMIAAVQGRFDQSVEQFAALAAEAAKCNHDLPYVVERMVQAQANKQIAHIVLSRMSSVESLDKTIAEFKEVKDELTQTLLHSVRSTSRSTSPLQSFADDCKLKALGEMLQSHAFTNGQPGAANPGIRNKK